MFLNSPPCLIQSLQQVLLRTRSLQSQEKQKVLSTVTALHAWRSQICLGFKEDVLFKQLKVELQITIAQCLFLSFSISYMIFVIVIFCYVYLKKKLLRNKLYLTSNSCLRNRTGSLDAFLQRTRHFSACLQHQAKQKENSTT